MNEERFLVISKNAEFFNLFDNTGFELLVSEKYDINLVESQIKDYGPSIIAIDSLLEDIDCEKLKQLQKLSLNELLLYFKNKKNTPLFVKILRDLHLMRVRNNWSRCLLLVMVEDPVGQLLHGLRQLGADRVITKRFPSKEYLINAISRIRRLIPKNSETKRLNVLVAENHIDTFLLIESILSDFCDLKLAVDNKNGSMRDTAELSSKRIVQEFNEASYDAVIMDLALSINQEQQAKYIEEDRIVGSRSFNSPDIKAQLMMHLTGLVAITLLRRVDERIPICVLSNYISQPKFRKILKRCLEEDDVFYSISFFEKDQRGRKNMRNWLKHLC